MMLTNHMDYFRRKPMNVHKITILVDSGYHPGFIMAELEKIYPQIGRKIRIEKSPKISPEQKKLERKKGFVVVKARWIIERSNAWMERCKNLVKNFERTLFNSTQKVNLCFIRLLLKRLTAS